MEHESLFVHFDRGRLFMPGGETELSALPWSPHPSFPGVELKHLVTARQTGGAFSYHLVRIAPGKEIGRHVHKSQLETHEVAAGKGVCATEDGAWPYEPGTVSILPAGLAHGVLAGEEGLLLLAKFFPALT